MKAFTLLPALPLFFTPVIANTEKAIFLGPPAVNIPQSRPTISDLRLPTLTPLARNTTSLRTKLTPVFPSPQYPDGSSTWLLLDDLTPGQRYEVRVCWAATQPTTFHLTPYPLETVFDSPDLITSLNAYSSTRQPSEPSLLPPSAALLPPNEVQKSLLFLHILAAADFYSSDSSLMKKPPPVDVDIILDPFLLNVLPKSLLPTVCYILVVALAAIFVSGKIVRLLKGLIASSLETSDEKKTQ
ncbi:hypothetical protein QBC35DRAFT_490995 [Podospora australis]|uniref:Uncharacterized protein n=1 Tax=Podospora australis TaxID=1536484 RepID=A0AAN6WXX5_9PEZI|nr:hypothetical protein QBC35DRAFT_490995 [Podospora australis]